MDIPTDFHIRHGWILVGIVGAAILIASGLAKFVPGFLVGLALLLCGVGRWIDYKTTRHTWRPTVVGMVVSIAGVALFALGIYSFVAP